MLRHVLAPGICVALSCAQVGLDSSRGQTEWIPTPADCPSRSNVIRGTEGPDLIEGTRGPDCIFAFGGDDHVLGLGGDDWIVAGSGDDSVSGGAGNDRIWGGAGGDALTGDDGNDGLYGGEHRDSLAGGAGEDLLEGGDGADVLEGDAGDDLLFGLDGDVLEGGAGNDRLVGLHGAGVFEGGSGDDLLSGQGHLAGGDGADRLIDVGDSTVDGGAGQDACDGQGCETGLQGCGVSRIGRQIRSILETRHDHGEGSTWGVSCDNQIVEATDPRDHWLVQSPAADVWATGSLHKALTCEEGCSTGMACIESLGLCACSSDSQCGQEGQCIPLNSTVDAVGSLPLKACAGSASHLYERIYDQIVQTEEHLEMATLHVNSQRVVGAITNALKVRNEAEPAGGHMPHFRFAVAFNASVDGFMDSITREIADGDDFRIRISVASYGGAEASWNHTKVLIRDDVEVMTGGHAIVKTDPYDDVPTHDLSVVTRGGAARETRNFFDTMWRYTCETSWPVDIRSRPGDDNRAGACQFPAGSSVSLGPGIPVLSVASTGAANAVNSAEDRAGDAALLEMIASARHDLTLAQHWFVLFSGSLDVRSRSLVNALAQAMLRGVNVTFIVGKGGITPPGLQLLILHNALAEELDGSTLTGGFKDGNALACARLRPRYFYAPHSPDSDHHAKIVVADVEEGDSTVAYVGSQNLYPSGLSEGPVRLSEHGFMLDDADAARAIFRDYLEPILDSSGELARTALCR